MFNHIMDTLNDIIKNQHKLAKFPHRMLEMITDEFEEMNETQRYLIYFFFLMFNTYPILLLTVLNWQKKMVLASA